MKKKIIKINKKLDFKFKFILFKIKEKKKLIFMY